MKKKSHGANILLTLLFGPLGLLYASAWQAVILTVVTIGLASVASVTGVLVVWGLCILLGASAVKKHNDAIILREDKEERRHQELLDATRQGAGRG